jgi:hypothetical protein
VIKTSNSGEAAARIACLAGLREGSIEWGRALTSGVDVRYLRVLAAAGGEDLHQLPQVRAGDETLVNLRHLVEKTSISCRRFAAGTWYLAATW